MVSRNKIDTLFSWSSGKDSSFALYKALNDDTLNVKSLITTVTEGYDRVSMHGVRNSLLDQQALEIGLPLDRIVIPKECTSELYENAMRTSMLKHQKEGINTVIFGDIFLEDVRKYREEKLSIVNMDAIFPLWGLNTTELAKEFINKGFKTIITCVDTHQLGEKFVGRVFDHQFLADLPESVDPCGENGEFHTFVYDGPIFKNPINIKTGEKTLRDNRFMFCDLIEK